MSVLKTTQQNNETNINNTNFLTSTGRAPIDAQNVERSKNGRFSIVVKGKIENKESLTKCLTDYDYTFGKNVQEELVGNLLEWYSIYCNFNTKEAINRVLSRITGNISIVIYDETTPDKFYAVRRDEDLFIGVVEKTVYIANQKSKLDKYTASIIQFENNSIATIHENGRVILQKLVINS